MMANLGMGVMINMLFDDGMPSTAIENSKGRKIDSIDLVKDASGSVGDLLLLTFRDGYSLKIFDDGQSCCEDRYLHTDDALDTFEGAEFIGARIQDAPDVEDEWGVHEVQFLIVDTSFGSFTVETHNAHNGYYGGFWIVAREVPPSA